MPFMCLEILFLFYRAYTMIKYCWITKHIIFDNKKICEVKIQNVDADKHDTTKT